MRPCCLCLAVSSRTSEEKELDPEEKPEEKQPPYHVLARNLLYPGSHTIRFPVPDEKVPWEVGAQAVGLEEDGKWEREQSHCCSKRERSITFGSCCSPQPWDEWLLGDTASAQ